MLTLTLAALISVASLQNPATGTQPPAPVTGAQIAPVPAVPPATSEALAIQVMLDRAGFSPGTIDGSMGRNTRSALSAYQQQHGDQGAPAGEPLARYRITPEDLAGPFTPDIPSDLVQQGKLPSLG